MTSHTEAMADEEDLVTRAGVAANAYKEFTKKYPVSATTFNTGHIPLLILMGHLLEGKILELDTEEPEYALMYRQLRGVFGDQHAIWRYIDVLGRYPDSRR